MSSLESCSDTELIIAYRHGDEKALTLLIQRYFSSVYRFLARMVGDATVAEDLTQETFVKTWKNLGQFDVHKTFKPWLFSIARNAAIDNLRKKRPLSFSSLEEEDQASFSDILPDPRVLSPTLLEQADIKQQVADALDQLPPKTKAIVLMHETEELTFQQIADSLNEPMNTVKSRYRRGLLFLQTKLTPEGDARHTLSTAPKSLEDT